jgi:hypothetical protein
MGLAGFLMHKSAKSSIKKTIDWYEQFTSDQRGAAIFYIWFLRGHNLAGFMGNSNVNIPIYFYQKGAEVPLSRLRNDFGEINKTDLLHAASHHLYTNLAATFPDEGYGPLVRNMWSLLFNHHTDMKYVVREMQPLLNTPSFKELILNNDVSADELAENPNLIMPHFLVPGHKLSAILMENEKLANSILNR